MKKYDKFKTFYHKREIQLLAEYLGKPHLIPKAHRDPAALEPVPDDWDEAKQGIGIQKGFGFADQSLDSKALDNAVARICLASEQEALPQWAAVDKEYVVLLGRKVTPLEQLPERLLLPVHLFTINWATGALPGMIWPEAYYLTHLPIWDVYVVTASRDTSETCGYEDFAIGWFRGKADAIEGSHKVLVAYWNSLSPHSIRTRWEVLHWANGDPESWADEVWPPTGRSKVKEEAGRTGGSEI